MTGTVLKQIDLAAKIGQDGSAMQAMHALGVIRDLIAGYTTKLTAVEDERAAFEAWATHLPMDRQPLRPDLYMPHTQWAWEAWQARAVLAQSSQDAPYADGIAADLERSDWTPEDALRWYAAGKHFDTTNGRTRIIDTGAIASNALKHLSLPSPAQAEAEQLREAYEWGYGDGQSNPNGYSDKKERDACVNKLLKQPSPAQVKAEQPEVVAFRGLREPLTTVAECERIVGALREEVASLKHSRQVLVDSRNAHRNERDAALARVAELEAELKTECMRLAACGTAALGYFDGCADAYKSASLSDVLRLRGDCDAALAKVAELESKLSDTQPYKQHPQIVGYARKKELAPLLDPTQPDGSHIYIGLDHPACWAEEPPYEFLTPLYTGPVAQHSVPDGYRLIRLEHFAAIKAQLNPEQVDAYRGRNVYDEDKVYANWNACRSALDEIKDVFQQIDWDAENELAELEKQEPAMFRAAQVVSYRPGIGEVTFYVDGGVPGFMDIGNTIYVSDRAPSQTRHSVPDEYVLVPVEPLLNMMSDKDHDTRITAERQLLSILAAAPGKGVPQAWLDVQAERRRQVEVEGWTPEHDDGHACDEIAAFACYYAMPPAVRDWDASSTGYGDTLGKAVLPEGWEPKTGDRRRELVKACALALAEIERLDRAAEKEQE